MESRPISRDSAPSTPTETVKGKVVGPAPDGEGLIVEVAGQAFQAKGDPSTQPGTAVQLQPDRDGGWKAAPLGKSLPPELRAQLELVLANLLESPATETFSLPAPLRKALQEAQANLGAKGQAVLPQAQALAELLRRLPGLPESAPPLAREAKNRPLLLKAESSAPPTRGQQFLEITGPGPRPSASPATTSYSARLGGKPVLLEGPPGLSGSQGLWDAWPASQESWLTPTPARANSGVQPPLPRTVERSAAGIAGVLQRLLPESLSAQDPALARQVSELASQIAEVLEEIPAPGPSESEPAQAPFPSAASPESSPGPTPASKEIDTRTLLRLLDAWSREESQAVLPSQADPVPTKARLRELLEGVVARHAPLEVRAAALAALAGAHGNALPALEAWVRQNLSEPPKPLFPLGTGGADPLEELPLAVARDLARLPPESPLRAELREAARDLLGSDLRSGHSPDGKAQLPWVQPQPQGWQEGNLRVVDRRKSRGPETPPDLTRVAISMTPPGLGQVDASLELSGLRLGVELRALDAETARLVRRELPQLERALKALGLEPALSAPEEAPRLSARRTVPQARSGLDLQA